ncbi:MAG TPA: acetolactate synthase large subunit [Ktedonobacteraceae bacterium]|nr:acetolactate synthase large subunit [Ktedonobacteraceae bacterium]
MTDKQKPSMRTPANEPEQGADLFFQAALQYGYRYIFGNPGTTEAVFMDALVRYPNLQFVLCLFENAATGAADGVARLTGWPALVNLHLYPGLANGLSNIHNALRARVPMVITVGQHDTRHLLEDSSIAGDIEGLAQTVCKWTWTVKHAGELAEVLQRATTIAMTPPRGPVCLILPTNILAESPRTPDGQVPDIPALHIPQLGPVPHQDITHVAAILLSAQHPLLLVGDIDPGTHEQIALLVKLLKGQVVYDGSPTRMDGRVLQNSSWLPYFPEQRRKALQKADVILTIGVSSFTSLFFYSFDSAPLVAPETQIIQLGEDLSGLGKNARGSLLLYGDIQSSLSLLVVELRERLQQPESAAQSRIALRNRDTHNNATTTNIPLTPKVLMQTLQQVLPEDTILINESITVGQSLINEILNAGAPVGTYLASRGGALGAGIPLAIGAQLGAPDQPVVAVVGDGSAMYSIQALWSLARYHLPVLTIICNNASYDIIKLEILRLGGTLAARGPKAVEGVTSIGEPRLDFVQLAEGMGVRGWSVKQVEEILPALQAALALCAKGEPALLDVHLSSHP